MLYLLQQMYKDLNLTEIFNIEVILPKVTLFETTSISVFTFVSVQNSCEFN